MVNIQLAELIFCVVMVQEVRCHSNGAPSSACSDMTPRHHNMPQSIPSPYSISVSKNTYKPLENITVTLQANSGVTFKGFLIQSRRDPNSDATIGTFIIAPGTKNTCSSQASLTQLDSSLKRNLSLTWIAPSATDGNVVFVATFVQNMSTYWVKVHGPIVIPQVLPPPSPPPPSLPKAVTIILSTTPKASTSTNFTTKPKTPTTTISTQLADTTTISTTKLITTTISTQLADTTMNSTAKLRTTTTTIPTQLADTTIAITKPTTPTTTIPTQLADTTTNSTTKLPTTTISTQLANTTIAITKPTTPTTTTIPTNMADTTTIATTETTTTYESLATGIHLTTTPTSTKDTVDQPGFDATCFDLGCGTTKGCFHDCNYGASWTFLVTWKDNGGDSVEFEMKAKIPTADNYWVSLGLSDDKKMVCELTLGLSDDKKMVCELRLGLSDDKKMVCELTLGLSDDKKMVCELTLGLSDDKIMVCELTLGLSDDKKMVCELRLGLSDDKKMVCELTLGLSDDKKMVCELRLGLSDDKKMVCELTLGLSDDKKMGNDSVMDCIVNSGAITVHSSYNLPEYSNELLQPDTFGITSKSGKVENGVLTCSFSRVRRFDLVSSGMRKRRVASSVDSFFDLDTDWYLFLARGNTNGATITKSMHTSLQIVSMVMADFQTLRDISSPYTGLTQEPSLSTTTLLQTISPGFDATCFDLGCGTTKGCFHDCNYGASWTFLVTWKDNGGDSVEFEMKAKIPTADNYWVSLGLSDDKKMGNDSVMDCIVNSGAITVHSSYNLPEYSNELLQPDTFGITSKSGKVENGVLTCSFSRVRRFDLVSSGMRKRRVASSVDSFFDLDTDWYLFLARGNTNGATITKSMHTSLPTVSMVMADFQTLRDISSPYTGLTQEPSLSTTTLLQTISPGFDATCFDLGCGTSKGCFHDCSYGASWTFLVTWKDNGGDSVEIEMKAKIPTADNYWVSLGLSDDKIMGNDSVMDCIVHSGTVTVHSSYNFPEKSNGLLQPDTFGITSKSGKVENGVLTCSFSRVRRFDLVSIGKRKRRVASSVDNFFDLDTDWYLFLARGNTNGATTYSV
ncbi:hypothetical protein CHS0354_018319 [Potamilus streckersoni]|uniref:Reelin domain-containing protein n=1 Tax=Potamilus streckersoni TaxID=2493646 RepID=A0AAE0WDT7_9BIVA|nr:hypothetical protein CHS0354_018319 [Potamilus streckersoni]